MTRCQSRWVNVVIIALVVILRAPTLLPSMCLTDEDYYSTIASDILDGGKVYHTAVDTKPPGIYYVYAGVYRIAGRNNLFAIHLLAIFVVTATALVVRRIGARVADEWSGAWILHIFFSFSVITLLFRLFRKSWRLPAEIH